VDYLVSEPTKKEIEEVIRSKLGPTAAGTLTRPKLAAGSVGTPFAAGTAAGLPANVNGVNKDTNLSFTPGAGLYLIFATIAGNLNVAAGSGDVLSHTCLDTSGAGGTSYGGQFAILRALGNAVAFTYARNDQWCWLVDVKATSTFRCRIGSLGLSTSATLESANWQALKIG
jgi:hypothetical protein